jgi:hypothetical protein
VTGGFTLPERGAIEAARATAGLEGSGPSRHKKGRAPLRAAKAIPLRPYWPSTQAKISGATIVASLSTMYFGVEAASLPQVIFSFGTAPE